MTEPPRFHGARRYFAGVPGVAVKGLECHAQPVPAHRGWSGTARFADLARCPWAVSVAAGRGRPARGPAGAFGRPTRSGVGQGLREPLYSTGMVLAASRIRWRSVYCSCDANLHHHWSYGYSIGFAHLIPSGFLSRSLIDGIGGFWSPWTDSGQSAPEEVGAFFVSRRRSPKGDTLTAIGQAPRRGASAGVNRPRQAESR